MRNNLPTKKLVENIDIQKESKGKEKEVIGKMERKGWSLSGEGEKERRDGVGMG